MVCKAPDPSEQPPHAAFTVDTKMANVSVITAGHGHEYVTYNAEISCNPSVSNDPDGRIVRYGWDFVQISGDSKFPDYHAIRDYPGPVCSRYSLGINESAVILVTLQVHDDDGLNDSTSKYVTIYEYYSATENKEPIVNFDVHTANGNWSAGIPAYIYASAIGSIDIDGRIVQYDWDFVQTSGDSKFPDHHLTITLQNYQCGAEHQYLLGGGESAKIQVRLTLTDDRGAINTGVEDVTIYEITNKNAPAEPRPGQPGFESAFFFIAIAGLLMVMALKRKRTS